MIVGFKLITHLGRPSAGYFVAVTSKASRGIDKEHWSGQTPTIQRRGPSELCSKKPKIMTKDAQDDTDQREMGTSYMGTNNMRPVVLYQAKR